MIESGRASDVSNMNSGISRNVGGIILCGGRSSRMGRPKLALPFGPELLLQRVTRILLEVVSPVVVVAASGQELPPLPTGVRVLRDEREGLGPLGGLAVGLGAIRGQVDAAFVTACDTPLLMPAFARFMIQSLGEHDLVIPRDGKFHHPLAAVYRTNLEDKVRALIAAERMRPVFLVEEAKSREIPVDELRSVDPELQSLQNTNTPEAYAAALAMAGFETTTNFHQSEDQ